MTPFVACLLLLVVGIANGTPLNRLSSETMVESPYQQQPYAEPVVDQPIQNQQYVDTMVNQPAEHLIQPVVEPVVEPVNVKPKYPMKLTDTVKTIQSVAWIAVMDVAQPLYTAVYTLETKWFHFLEVASSKKIQIPKFYKPTIQLDEIFTCKPKSYPKYQSAYRFLMEKQEVVDYHVKTATAMSKGLDFVAELILNNMANDEILVAVAKKISIFLSDYSRFLSALKYSVCSDAKYTMRETKQKPFISKRVDSAETLIRRTSKSNDLMGRADHADASNSLVGREIPDASNNLVGREIPDASNSLLGREIPDASNNLVGREIPDASNSLLGREIPDASNSLLGREIPDASNNLVGREIPDASNSLLGREIADASNSLLGRAEDSAGNLLERGYGGYGRLYG